jgi:glutathione S-transferase
LTEVENFFLRFQMPLSYYYDLLSQPCRAVYIFLKMTGIPFQPKEVALRKLENMTDELVKINTVPVIDDSGFILTERSY